MMEKLAEEVTSRHEGLIKEAIFGMLGRGLWSAGKWIVKNPGKSLSVGLPALEVGSAASKGFKTAPTAIGSELRRAGLRTQLPA